MNKIIFVSYATHSERLYDTLVESAKRNSINLNVLGYNTKWEGWKKRAETILNFLNKYDNNKLVCHIDGFDSIILGSEEELYKKFMKYYKNKKVVFSLDNSKHLHINYYKIKKYGMCNNNYISAGLFMGYNYYVKKILTEFINSDYSDDQKFFISLCRKDDYIGIDNNILFYNYQYFYDSYGLKYKNNRVIVNNNKPVIISAPGNININSILENFNYPQPKDYKRDFMGYLIKNGEDIIKMFFVEVILIIMIIFVLIKIFKKK
jgi:hypothetical protein